MEASVKILNCKGIEGLSMRTIAKELNIKAASLYWHFSGKLDLYGAIAEYLCLRYEMPAESDDPKDYLISSYKAYRAMLLSTRDSVSVLENSIPNTPRRMEIIRAMSKAFLKMGVKQETLTTVSNLFNNYVLSFVADECRFKNTTPDKIHELEQMLCPEDRLFLSIPSNFDEQFLYGLQVLFAGLEALRSREQNRTEQ
ncbi:tetracycline repressor protein class A [Peptococcaceae bacterium CEB3]|nr:tetracycline repressor protein class A [Peptococcaceae bacterium CEB3]